MSTNKFRYPITYCAFVILCFSANVFSVETSNQEKQSSLLKEKIFSSLGRTSTGNEQPFTIKEMHKALLLSCEHSPGCSHKELKALKERKQPKSYNKKRALRNADIIFQQKGWSVVK